MTPQQIKSTFKETMADVNGRQSSKRYITLISFVCMIVMWIANQFFGYEVSSFIVKAFLYITCAGLGSTALEHFSKFKLSKLFGRKKYG